MRSFLTDRYQVRLAERPEDLAAAQHLRWRCFLARQGGAEDGADADALDDRCRHMLIEDRRSGALVATFRFLPLESGAAIEGSYSAQFYDLSRLRRFGGPMIEVGRFCIHPEARDPDILRLAWAALTRQVDTSGAELLFGCSSFVGAEAEPHADALAMLRQRHLAPRRWLPRVKAPQVFRFARALRLRKPDPKRAMAAMPPLLRSYLAMGGWVGDHAVVDRQMDTLHVFTGLEIRAIPPGRARLLRALA